MGFVRGHSEGQLEAIRDPDRECVHLAIAGDHGAFAELVQKYQVQVYRLVLRQVRDESLARELAQETFVKVFRHLHSFRFDASFKTWLLKISMNCVRSYFASRRHKEHLQTSSLSAGDQEFPQRCDTVDLSAMKQLLDAIQMLPEELREVLVLCGVEQYAYEEAACVLDIPIGTVRSRLHRARMMLRDRYFKTEEEENGR